MQIQLFSPTLGDHASSRLEIFFMLLLLRIYLITYLFAGTYRLNIVLLLQKKLDGQRVRHWCIEALEYIGC